MTSDTATVIGPPGAMDTTRRRDLLLAGLIVAVGGWLRFQHLDAGIPHAIDLGEPLIMDRAVAMMKSGDFHPRTFEWPSLTIYLHLILGCFTFLFGAMDGTWRHLDQVGPSHMYLNGRVLTAAFGTATIWLTYLVGARWGRVTGLIGAALLAVLPLHVRESHYVLTSVPTAFFTTLTVWLALRAHERATWSTVALAGAAAGLAASTAYAGLIVLVVPLAVGWLHTGRAIVRGLRAAVILAAAAAAFVVGTPYALLDLPAFLNATVPLAAAGALDSIGESGGAAWLRHLHLTLGPPALWLAAVGLVGAWWRTIGGPDRARWAGVTLFPTVYVGVMARRISIDDGLLMPLLPVAALLGAIATMAIVDRLTRTRLTEPVVHLVSAAVVIAALATPVRASVAFTQRLGQESTVDRAYAWIRSNVPPGARVIIERQAFQLPGTTYQVAHVPSLIARTHDEYAADAVDYLVASSTAYGAAFSGAASREHFVAYQTLFTRAEQVAVFMPSDETPGPELRILRIRR